MDRNGKTGDTPTNRVLLFHLLVFCSNGLMPVCIRLHEGKDGRKENTQGFGMQVDKIGRR